MVMIGAERLDRETVERIASHYDATEEDAGVFSERFRAPIRRRRYLEIEELTEIVRWKVARELPRARSNDPQTVRLVTGQAFALADPKLAIWTLCYLKGVWVRMASAVLTAFDPGVYTVMDVRAWASLEAIGLDVLGVPAPKSFLGLHLDRYDTYEAYLHACRRLAADFGVSLRVLDRCLWVLNGRAPSEIPGR